MNLSILREDTREQHEATEALLPLTGPGLDRERYADLLQCFSQVVLTWEGWSASHAPPELATLVQARRRGPLMLADLRTLELSAPTTGDAAIEPLQTLLEGMAPESPEYQAAFLGAMYVMEGSTLGGQYIARHVEEVLGFAPGEGDAYFRGYGEHTGSMWNAFREVLGAVPDEHTGTVVAAAKAMFAYVQDTMRPCPALREVAAPGPSSHAVSAR